MKSIVRETARKVLPLLHAVFGPRFADVFVPACGGQAQAEALLAWLWPENVKEYLACQETRDRWLAARRNGA